MNERILLSVAAAGLLAACGDGSSGGGGVQQQLTFRGNGNPASGAVFNGPHAGQTVRAALLDGATVLDIQKTTVAASGDPAFSVTFAPAIDMSKAYTVHYWIDSNFGSPPLGAGACDPMVNDHQWSVAIPAGTTTRTEVHTPANTAEVCGTFTFPLTFTGDASFGTAHNGRNFHAALARGAEATALDTVDGVIAAGGFSAPFTPELVVGEPYSVKLWVDVNQSNTCDAPPTDHSWTVDVPTSLAGHQTTLTYAHVAANFTNVCSFFAPPAFLTFQGAGAGPTPFNGPHAGQTLRAALLDGAAVLDIQKTTVAATGTDPAFSVTFTPAIDTAKAYTIHYWVDSNFGTPPLGAGWCDPKANDHQWSVTTAAGETTKTVVHDNTANPTTDVCGTFTFPLTFRGDGSFGAIHNGQAFQAGLVAGAAAAAAEVLGGNVTNANPDLQVTFVRELVIGEPYSVKLWVNSGGTAACEAPPTDHQWSFDVPTTLGAAETLAVAHTASFTSVCSFFP